MDPLSMAVLIGAIGGWLGMAGGLINKEVNDAAQEEQMNDQLAVMDEEWQQDQQDAFTKAANTEKSVDLQAAVLGDEVNATARSQAQQAEENTLSYNSAAMSAGQEEGAGYAQAAQSGTRSSSAVNSAAMGAEYNAKALQTQEDSDRLSQELSLQSAMNSAYSESQGLTQSWQEAQQLRSDYTGSLSYNEDGSVNYENTAEAGRKFNLYRMQRQNYEKANSPDDSFWSWANAGISGFTSGASYGAKAASWTAQWVK